MLSGREKGRMIVIIVDEGNERNTGPSGGLRYGGS